MGFHAEADLGHLIKERLATPQEQGLAAVIVLVLPPVTDLSKFGLAMKLAAFQSASTMTAGAAHAGRSCKSDRADLNDLPRRRDARADWPLETGGNERISGARNDDRFTSIANTHLGRVDKALQP